MGLFRKSKPDSDMSALIEQAQQQAQQAMAGLTAGGMDPQSLMAMAAQAQQPGAMDWMTAYRDRSARVSSAGVEMPATLRSVVAGAPSALLGGTSVQFGVTVEPPGGAPYDVDTDQVMPDVTAAALAPGQRVTVRVDPQDPQCLLIYGTPSAPSPPAPAAAAPAAAAASGDLVARLQKLQELREMGALTEDEFAAQKAKLLDG